MTHDPTHALASAVCAVFVALALWHFYMALGGLASGADGAVPRIGGQPLFMPSAQSTVAVGIALLLFAALLAATAGLPVVGLPTRLLVWLSYALAAGLLARAIGEFRYVGFFKRVRGTPFARLDTLLYSPQ